MALVQRQEGLIQRQEGFVFVQRKEGLIQRQEGLHHEQQRLRCVNRRKEGLVQRQGGLRLYSLPPHARVFGRYKRYKCWFRCRCWSSCCWCCSCSDPSPSGQPCGLHDHCRHGQQRELRDGAGHAHLILPTTV